MALPFLFKHRFRSKGRSTQGQGLDLPRSDSLGTSVRSSHSQFWNCGQFFADRTARNPRAGLGFSGRLYLAFHGEAHEPHYFSTLVQDWGFLMI